MKRYIDHGYTIIEMVMVITLLGLMVSAAALMFRPVLETWSLDSPQNATTDASAYALSRMAFEISQIKDQANVVIAGAGQIKFTDVSNNSINYWLSGTNLMRNSDILARGIQTFTVKYYDVNSAVITTPKVSPQNTDIWKLTISISNQREDQMVTMETEIHPRNFPRS